MLKVGIMTKEECEYCGDNVSKTILVVCVVGFVLFFVLVLPYLDKLEARENSAFCEERGFGAVIYQDNRIIECANIGTDGEVIESKEFIREV